MRVVLDASVWVAAALADELRHSETRAWLRGLAAEPLVIPTLGLVELGGAVRRRTGSAALAREAVAAVERLPNLVIVLPDARVWAASVRIATTRAIRGADAVYIAIADILGMPLATWDIQQRERAPGHVKVITPAAS